MMENALPSLLRQYLQQSPLILVWLAGIILALIFWRRHPAVSLLTFLASLVFLVKGLLTTWLYHQLPHWIVERNWTHEQIDRVYFFIGISNTVVSALLWGLMLWAIFGWRTGRGDRMRWEKALGGAPPARPGPGSDIPYTEFREGRP
jgi:hypothetical protein